MKKTESRFTRIMRTLGCAAVVVGSTTNSARAGSAPKSTDAPAKVSLANEIITGIPDYLAQIDSMIDDAMQDNVLDASERKLILKQASRTLSKLELEELDVHLAGLPTPSAEESQQAPQPIPMNGGNSVTLEGNISPCCEEPTCDGLRDNLYIFSAVDAWKGPIDDDGNNNFGFRVGFNMGAPVPRLEDRQIGFQFGLSYAGYDFHGRESVSEASSIEDQLFLTTGLFSRSNLCGDECEIRRIGWGLVLDSMFTDNAGEGADEWSFFQLRGQIGYALDHRNEVGLQASVGIGGSEEASDGIAASDSRVDVQNQYSAFYHVKFPWGTDARVYTGFAEDAADWIIGANTNVPIAENMALFAGFNYIMPSTSGGADDDRYAEETWNVSAGISFYPRGNAKSRTVSGQTWMPLMPVADNGSFALEANPSEL